MQRVLPIKLENHATAYIPNHKFYLDELEFEYYNGVYFCNIGNLKRGNSFGELALISTDTTRNATIICETECVFAVLKKPSYDDFLHRIELI